MATANITARLDRTDCSTSWGFRLYGGKDFGVPLTIQRVTPGSLAHKCGLQVGDAIMRIGSELTDHLRHKDAQQRIIGSGNSLELGLQRSGGAMRAAPPAAAPQPAYQQPYQAAPAPAPYHGGGGPAYDQVGGVQQAPTAQGYDQDYNRTAAPFAPGGGGAGGPGGVPVAVNNQYNTPLPLYSPDSAIDSLAKQTGLMHASGQPSGTVQSSGSTFLHGDTDRSFSLHGVTPPPQHGVTHRLISSGKDSPDSSFTNGVHLRNGHDLASLTQKADVNSSKVDSGPKYKVTQIQSKLGTHQTFTPTSSKVPYFMAQSQKCDDGSPPPREQSSPLVQSFSERSQMLAYEQSSPPVQSSNTRNQMSPPVIAGSDQSGGTATKTKRIPFFMRQLQKADSDVPPAEQSSPPVQSHADRNRMNSSFTAGANQQFSTSSNTGKNESSTYTVSSHFESAPVNSSPRKLSGSRSGNQVAGDEILHQGFRNPRVQSKKFQRLQEQLFRKEDAGSDDSVTAIQNPPAVSRVAPPASSNITSTNSSNGGQSPTFVAATYVKQYNSPINMYSKNAIETTVQDQEFPWKPKAQGGVSPKLDSDGQIIVKPSPTHQLIQELENDDDSKSSTCSSDRSSPPTTRRTSLPQRRRVESTNGTASTSVRTRSGSSPVVRTEIHVKTSSPYISPLGSPCSSTSGSNFSEEDSLDGMCAPIKVKVFGSNVMHADTTTRIFYGGGGGYAAPAPAAPAPVAAPSGSWRPRIPTGPRKMLAGRAGDAKSMPMPTGTQRIPVCNSCGVAIRGPFVLALDKTWCPNHFNCSNPSCAKPLIGVGFVEEDGQLLCEQDYERFLAPRCGKCGNAIMRECVNALNNTFHPECFTCSQCGCAIGSGSFHVEDGKNFCEKDWQAMFQTKCYGCQFPIEPGDRWVDALNENWHSECFNCSTCQVNLEGQGFYAKSGKPYCKKHAKGGKAF